MLKTINCNPPRGYTEGIWDVEKVFDHFSIELQESRTEVKDDE
jgi:hypothetical protein